MNLFDAMYILGFFSLISVFVGVGFKAFDINIEKVNKLFHLED